MRTYHYIVADDERLIRTSLIKQITTFTNGVFIFAGEASNGFETMQILERSAVDVVFSDVRMSGMDGLELSKQIAGRFPWIKVVLISGYSDFEYVRMALHYGVSDYLLKPIDPDKLANTVDTILEQLRNAEEKELDMLLALIESKEEPRRDQWKQFLLKQQSAEAVKEVISVLSPRLHPLHKRPRLLLRLLHAWSGRFLQKTGLAVSVPFSPELSHSIDWLKKEDWELALSAWISQICEVLHHHPPATGHKVVSDVKQLIHVRYAENLTLEELAAATFLNKTYLAGLFKQSTSLTIGQYIQEVRMKQACHLLETTRMKIHEIAVIVGYHDLSHFSKTFKQYVGVNPQVYRNMAGASPDAGSTHEHK